MMKKSMSFSVLIVLFCFFLSFSYKSSAEESFFSIAENALNQMIDCSDKEYIPLQASGYDPAACVFSIDCTEGNQTITMVAGERAVIVYPFELDELYACIVEMLFDFEALETQLSNGRYLQYDLIMTRDERYSITKENLFDFVALLLEGEQQKEVPKQYGYSSVPFENLEFTDFLYKEFSSGNAQISGLIKNHNDYAVDGYFYILFYKNNQLVHTELSALPRIQANAVGVWSDLIYGVDYDRIEYADSNVVRK